MEAAAAVASVALVVRACDTSSLARECLVAACESLQKSYAFRGEVLRAAIRFSGGGFSGGGLGGFCLCLFI